MILIPVACLHMLASYVKNVETISLQETMQGLIFLQNNLIEGNEFTRFGCVGKFSKESFNDDQNSCRRCAEPGGGKGSRNNNGIVFLWRIFSTFRCFRNPMLSISPWYQFFEDQLRAQLLSLEDQKSFRLGQLFSSRQNEELFTKFATEKEMSLSKLASWLKLWKEVKRNEQTNQKSFSVLIFSIESSSQC